MSKCKCLPILLALLIGSSLICCPAAMAEDCFILNVDTLDMDSLRSEAYISNYLCSQAQGIQVIKYISNSSELAMRVRLTLLQADTKTLIFDKDYGYQSGIFDSGAIYLPYVEGESIPYIITLYLENTVYALPFIRKQARLRYNGACTCGPRLRELDAALTDDWQMGTMIDLNALRINGSQNISICASNAYIIGQAFVCLSGDILTVQLNFSPMANVELHDVRMYVITDVSSGSLGAAYHPGEGVNVSGEGSALLYLPMRVSYDSAGLSAFVYEPYSSDMAAQFALWYSNFDGSAEYTQDEDFPEAIGWLDGQFPPSITNEDGWEIQ